MKKIYLNLFLVVSLFLSFKSPNSGYKLKLRTLYCIYQEDFFGTDQVYIKVNGEKVSSTARISSGGNLDLSNLNRYYFEDDIKVEVYEYDWEGDDLLLSATITGDEAGEGINYKSGSHRTAKYKLSYEVFHN